jgi:hypothetical protein
VSIPFVVSTFAGIPPPSVFLRVESEQCVASCEERAPLLARLDAQQNTTVTLPVPCLNTRRPLVVVIISALVLSQFFSMRN